MARDILFRGKREGKWIEGSLVRFPDGTTEICYSGEKCDIDELDKATVDAETVGQFTGRLDRNGRKIFEGDICRFLYDNGKTTNYEVFWFPEGSRWGVRELGRSGIYIDALDVLFCPRCEVVGTIFDDRT